AERIRQGKPSQVAPIAHRHGGTMGSPCSWQELGSTQIASLQTFPFYIGLLSCTLPFNLLMFGMNDMVDFDVDQLHARKGNYTWGARASKLELAQLPLLMVISNLCPMVILVAATGHLSSLIWVLGFLLCNIIYNLPPMAVARKGPWEFPCMLFGISCITMFSCDVNNVPTPSI
ncbi:hypothetical protein FOZ62_008467, partial [Perkinsus olseni]